MVEILIFDIHHRTPKKKVISETIFGGVLYLFKNKLEDTISITIETRLISTVFNESYICKYYIAKLCEILNEKKN